MASDDQPEDALPSAIGAYGGIGAIVSSGYFWTSLGLMIPTYSLWSKADWWETVIGVMPNLLGFTLGGFALISAIGDDRFKAIIAQTPSGFGKSSVLQSMAGTFFFFIFVQASALISALCMKGLWKGEVPTIFERFADVLAFVAPFVWFFSFLAFIYSLVLVIAAARWIYGIAMVHEMKLKAEIEEEAEESPPFETPIAAAREHLADARQSVARAELLLIQSGEP